MAFETQKNAVVAKKNSYNAGLNACQIDDDQPSLSAGPDNTGSFTVSFASPDNDSTEDACITSQGELTTALAQLRLAGGTYHLSTGTNPATGAPTAIVTFTN